MRPWKQCNASCDLLLAQYPNDWHTIIRANLNSYHHIMSNITITLFICTSFQVSKMCNKYVRMNFNTLQLNQTVITKYVWYDKYSRCRRYTVNRESKSLKHPNYTDIVVDMVIKRNSIQIKYKKGQQTVQ